MNAILGRLGPLVASLVIFVAGPVSAAPVSWTDWVVDGFPFAATGQLTVGAEVVQVNFTDSAGVSFIQTNSGTDYWLPDAPYLSGLVDNAPIGPDIIALSSGGLVTVAFSKPIIDPLIALASWNGNVVEFGEPIDVISFGAGYWGSGTIAVNGQGTGFTGVGEVHGVIRLPGVHSSFSFTHTTEDWHGITVGVVGVVPEPATAGLAAVVIGVVATRRRSRSNPLGGTRDS